MDIFVDWQIKREQLTPIRKFLQSWNLNNNENCCPYRNTLTVLDKTVPVPEKTVPVTEKTVPVPAKAGPVPVKAVSGIYEPLEAGPASMVRGSIYLSICLSIYLFICLSIYLSIEDNSSFSRVSTCLRGGSISAWPRGFN